MTKKEDKCRIEVQGEMTMERYASLQMLYYPLIGNDATTLYHSLVSIGTRAQKIKNHILLKSISGLSMEVITKSRRILEQYLLVKTYYNASRNAYIYQVFMPKDGNDFLRHEVFGRLYLKEMGKQVYEFNKLNFAHAFEEKDAYQEITMPFENCIKEDWEDEQEEQFHKMKPSLDILYENDVALSFNFDRFLTGLSTTIFPLKARSKKNLRKIGELATIYGIDELTMRKLVSKSMDLKQNDLNLAVLKKKVCSAKTSYEEKAHVNPYSLPPVRFLQGKQRGIEVSRSDKYLIETLIFDFKMKPEVVNVLIEYVLKTKHQQFPKSYVEKIASTWVRLEIDTYEKALKHIETDQAAPTHSKQVQQKELPSWFQNQDEVQSNIDDFDEEELLKDLKELRGE